MPVLQRRRRRLAALAGLAGLALGLLAPAPAPAAGVDAPRVSGMAWRSGASILPEGAGFAAWRGRPLDARVLFVPHRTWDQMRDQLRGDHFRSNCRATPLCIVSVAMFPKSAAGQFRQCAGGSFDAAHREMAGLIAAAQRGALVRIGWEANTGGGSHPWSIGRASNIGPYKDCFGRLARIHKQAGLRVEWTNSKGQAFPYMETYPGDDVVDVWGLHQYDNDTRGIQFADYVAAARRRGKKVAVAEWGMKRNGDNPEYVRRMFAQFRAHAANLAYESYFNRRSEHMLHPRTRYPRAAQAYRELRGR
ncbi:MAG TPA: hypothetical protein VF606_08035 [Geminicoccaceae bacterium]